MILRVLWLTPPVAAILSLLPAPQITTVKLYDHSPRVVSCADGSTPLKIQHVSAATVGQDAKDSGGKLEHSCVELPPALPWGWDFGKEVAELPDGKATREQHSRLAAF
jgi:hypothetical protein